MSNKVSQSPRVYYGSACKKDPSHSSDDQSLRYAIGGVCVRCQVDFSSLTDLEVEQYYLETKQRSPNRESKHDDQSEEAKKKRRSEASMRWNAKNKERTKEYQKVYLSKPEVAEKIKKENLKRYYNLSEEKLEARRESNRKWIERQKELKFTDPEAYEAKAKLRKEKQKARYDALTPEEKVALSERQRNYGKAYRERQKDKDGSNS